MRRAAVSTRREHSAESTRPVAVTSADRGGRLGDRTAAPDRSRAQRAARAGRLTGRGSRGVRRGTCGRVGWHTGSYKRQPLVVVGVESLAFEGSAGAVVGDDSRVLAGRATVQGVGTFADVSFRGPLSGLVGVMSQPCDVGEGALGTGVRHVAVSEGHV